MTVGIQNDFHPTTISKSFVDASSAKVGSSITASPAAITIADLTALPRQTQLLAAHCLEQNYNDFTLLDRDTDACNLVALGWLTSIPVSTIGILRFKFKPNIWRQLSSLRYKFLTNRLRYELSNYRQHKTTLYPWVW